MKCEYTFYDIENNKCLIRFTIEGELFKLDDIDYAGYEYVGHSGPSMLTYPDPNYVGITVNLKPVKTGYQSFLRKYLYCHED